MRSSQLVQTEQGIYGLLMIEFPSHYPNRSDWAGGHHECSIVLGHVKDEIAESRIRLVLTKFWTDSSVLLLGDSRYRFRNQFSLDFEGAALSDMAELVGWHDCGPFGIVPIATFVIRDLDGFDLVEIAIPRAGIDDKIPSIGIYEEPESWEPQVNERLARLALPIVREKYVIGAMIDFEIHASVVDEILHFSPNRPRRQAFIIKEKSDDAIYYPITEF